MMTFQYAARVTIWQFVKKVASEKDKYGQKLNLLMSADETHKDADLSSVMYGNKPGNKTGLNTSGRRSRQSSLSRRKSKRPTPH